MLAINAASASTPDRRPAVPVPSAGARGPHPDRREQGRPVGRVPDRRKQPEGAVFDMVAAGRIVSGESPCRRRYRWSRPRPPQNVIDIIAGGAGTHRGDRRRRSRKPAVHRRPKVRPRSRYAASGQGDRRSSCCSWPTRPIADAVAAAASGQAVADPHHRRRARARGRNRRPAEIPTSSPVKV